jgi:uncharacterized Zn-binding protein involved in type VI secretion
MHSCPAATPAPHVGGPVTGPGCATVLIGGMPAATAGDACTCTGPPDIIVAGSSGVFIGGKPAARMGDTTAHGGVIVGGCGTVLIGETKQKVFYRKPGLYDPEEEGWPDKSKEEKRAALLQAIQDSIQLLEHKLKLLVDKDHATLEAFNKWFGSPTKRRIDYIVQRIKRSLHVFNELTESNFEMINDTRDRRNEFAIVYPKDESFTIYLGYKFWFTEAVGKVAKTGILIHEVSHFEKVGRTKDYRYDEGCISLAKSSPRRALLNADSFSCFINS